MSTLRFSKSVDLALSDHHSFYSWEKFLNASDVGDGKSYSFDGEIGSSMNVLAERWCQVVDNMLTLKVISSHEEIVLFSLKLCQCSVSCQPFGFQNPAKRNVFLRKRWGDVHAPSRKPLCRGRASFVFFTRSGCFSRFLESRSTWPGGVSRALRPRASADTEGAQHELKNLSPSPETEDRVSIARVIYGTLRTASRCSLVDLLLSARGSPFVWRGLVKLR